MYVHEGGPRPRKSPEELNEAKRKRADERHQAEERRRLKEEEEEARFIRAEEARRQRAAGENALHERHKELKSYVTGIYEEVDKLSRKKSTEEVSDRMVGRANRAILAARELLTDEDDPFFEEIETFVPAGDPIEARDVVLTLRLVKDALDRMDTRHHQAWHPRLYG